MVENGIEISGFYPISIKSGLGLEHKTWNIQYIKLHHH